MGLLRWKYLQLLNQNQKVNVVIAKNNGGQLANQLWQFAVVAAFCKERGYQLYNPAFFHYAKYFERFHDDLLISPTSPLKTFLPQIQEIQRCTHRTLLKLLETQFPHHRHAPTAEAPLLLSSMCLDKGNHFLFDWYFENRSGIEKHRDYLLPLLKPKKTYEKKIEKFWKQIDGSRLVVGVHVRHKDFRTWNAGRYFFSVEEIKQHMKKVQSRYCNLNPLFIIYSDEKRSCDEFPEFNTRVSEGNLVEDLYSMARCHLIMGTGISTFNGWAAWYGNIPRYKFEETPDWNFLDQSIKNPDFVFQEENMPPCFILKQSDSSDCLDISKKCE